MIYQNLTFFKLMFMQTLSAHKVVYILLSFIIGLTSTNPIAAQDNPFVVVLDAGHGGGDPGNVGNGFKEKDIALNVVLQVGKALEKRDNIKVIYTRKRDVFIKLHERAKIANKADADLFVSVHCNAHSSQAYGTETFVLGEKNTGRNFEVAKRENQVIFLEEDYQQHYAGFDPNSPESSIAIGIEQEVYVEQSIVLARKIEDQFVNSAKRKSRGLKQASLLVIRNTYMPSVLVELGFLTNNNEGPFLNAKKGQKIMANALTDAILDFKKEIDVNISNRLDTVAGTNDSASNDTTAIYEGVVFKVQIAASSKDLSLKAYNFNGLDNLFKEKQGELFKYYYGETNDYNKAKDLQENAKSKGFESCFIVAFKNSKPVKLSEVIK